MTSAAMAASALAAVDVRGVTKTFAAVEGADIRALDGIALGVPQGESTAIVGPSGCGSKG